MSVSQLVDPQDGCVWGCPGWSSGRGSGGAAAAAGGWNTGTQAMDAGRSGHSCGVVSTSC